MMSKPRRRHPPRGSKRGRPRGSRRGGGTGSIGRSDLIPSTSTSGDPQQPGFSGNVSVVSDGGNDMTLPTFRPSVIPVKRGPGRPRLKPSGPANQGQRGPPRPRKPAGPLVVPLGSSPAPTPPGRSPAMSPAPSPAPPGTPQDRISYFQQSDDDIFIKQEDLS